MDNNNQQQGPQVKININEEVARGAYVNLAIVAHSSSEFVVDLCSNLPGNNGVNVVSRAILAPEHAKRLLMALQENVLKYEQTFGKITVPGMAERVISPFNTGRGEA